MNIALIGYGNMGKEIERLVNQTTEDTIVSISYRQKGQGLDLDGIKHADVAIDFTSPEIVLQNIRDVVSLGVPLVVGTTGWYDRLPEVKAMMTTAKSGLLYGQNFSIGANIFFQLIGVASQLTSQFKEYDVFGMETHHTGKKDSPSGTAKKIAEVILDNFPAKKMLQTEKLDRQIDATELHFASVRGGRSFGKHEVVFDSPADEIRLTHQAWSREGFARGAIIASHFIREKKGLYTFDAIFEKGEDVL